MAVFGREVVIQNAKDLFDYAEANLRKPSSQRFQSQVVKLKRWVFYYESQHDRERHY